MNNKIYELAKKATDLAVEKVSKGNEDTMTFELTFNQIFAELIINQCVELVREEYLPVLQDEDMMDEEHWKGYVGCGVDSVASIKHYFYGEADSWET